MNDVPGNPRSSTRHRLGVLLLAFVLVAAAADRLLDTRRQSEWATIGTVMQATVSIEKRIVWREKGTNRYLHEADTEGPQLREITDETELSFSPPTQAGSGLCISPAGCR